MGMCAMRRTVLIVLAVVTWVTAAAASVIQIKRRSTPKKSRIFINGNILTIDDNDSVVEAVALRRDRIVAVGATDEIMKLKRFGTVVVDLEGKTLMPGFIDAHSHFPGSGVLAEVGVDLNSLPIGKIENIPQLIEALRKKAKKTKKHRKIVGLGYDDTRLAEKRHPNRHDLDKASTNHPIFIGHISGHYAAVNAKALEILGIDKNTEDPEGGKLHRDPVTGEPTGVLEEKAVELAYEKGVDFSLLEQISIIRHAIRDYAAAGVTTAQNGLAPKKILKPLSIISKLGLLPLRVVQWPDEECGDEILSGNFDPDEHHTDMHTVGPVKLFADGSIQAYTGYLTEPYYLQPEGDDGYRGYPVQSREKLAEVVTKFHGAGLQIAIHGNGDAAIDDIIYAVCKAQEAHPRKDPRHILVHGQMTRPDQLDAMKKLGITPSYHSAHLYYWGDRHVEIFMGPERARRISPQKTTLEKGLRFTIHTDAPVVPMNPLHLVWCSVNRQSSGGRVIGEEERITPMQALRAITIDAAWQIFQEDNRGSIKPGKFADLVILSADPTAAPTKIKDIQVLETIVGGRTVYRRD